MGVELRASVAEERGAPVARPELPGRGLKPAGPIVFAGEGHEPGRYVLKAAHVLKGTSGAWPWTLPSKPTKTRLSPSCTATPSPGSAGSSSSAIGSPSSASAGASCGVAGWALVPSGGSGPLSVAQAVIIRPNSAGGPWFSPRLCPFRCPVISRRRRKTASYRVDAGAVATDPYDAMGAPPVPYLFGRSHVAAIARWPALRLSARGSRRRLALTLRLKAPKISTSRADGCQQGRASLFG